MYTLKLLYDKMYEQWFKIYNTCAHSQLQKCSSVFLNNIITILYIIINYETHLHRHTSEERIMFGGHPMSALQSTESRL